MLRLYLLVVAQVLYHPIKTLEQTNSSKPDVAIKYSSLDIGEAETLARTLSSTLLNSHETATNYAKISKELAKIPYNITGG